MFSHDEIRMLKKAKFVKQKDESFKKDEIVIKIIEDRTLLPSRRYVIYNKCKHGMNGNLSFIYLYSALFIAEKLSEFNEYVETIITWGKDEMNEVIEEEQEANLIIFNKMKRELI